MHSLIYKGIISHLPDKYVEKLGGFYYRLASIFSYTPLVDFPVELAGIIFPNPVGMPAGWIDTPGKLRTVRKLGVGIPTIKTITVNEKKGNPYPRIIRKGDSMINSLGLPNKGVDWWVENYTKPDYPTIISIKGNGLAEWTELIEKLEKKSEILELNLSCPNVGDGIMDIQASAQLVEDISSISNTKLFLKLSPEFKPEENVKLIQKVHSNIAGITAINTQPVGNDKLGIPAKMGGLSGREIHGSLKLQLNAIREAFPNMDELPLLASGGITYAREAISIIKDYRVIPMGLTAFLTKGPRYYYKISKEIENEFLTADKLTSFLKGEE